LTRPTIGKLGDKSTTTCALMKQMRSYQVFKGAWERHMLEQGMNQKMRNDRLVLLCLCLFFCTLVVSIGCYLVQFLLAVILYGFFWLLSCMLFFFSISEYNLLINQWIYLYTFPIIALFYKGRKGRKVFFVQTTLHESCITQSFITSWSS